MSLIFSKSYSPTHARPNHKKMENFLNNVGAAYNFACIGLVLISLSSSITETSSDQSLVGSASMMGAISGQLVLGLLGDFIGRWRALGVTSVFILVGSILSAVLPQNKENLLIVLAACRFVTGFGVGGVYPLSAVASTEEKGIRSTLFVFAGQGWGQVLAPFTVFALAYSGKYDAETIWRTTLGLGALPSLLALGIMAFRTRRRANGKYADQALAAIVGLAGDHPDNVEFERDEQVRRAQEARLTGAVPERGVFTPKRWSQAICERRHFKKLVGTGGTWFLFDVTFYANVVFAPIVLERVFGSNAATTSETVKDIAGPTAIAVLIGLPGYYLAALFAERIGLKRMQMIGFASLAVVYGVLAATSHILPPSALFALYSFTFFISNFGPNAATFCLPSKTFPREVRSTMNGISAAMGKLGAVVGTVTFPYLMNQGGLPMTLGISSGVAVLGLFLTYFSIDSDFAYSRVGNEVGIGENGTQNSLTLSRDFVGFVEMGPAHLLRSDIEGGAAHMQGGTAAIKPSSTTGNNTDNPFASAFMQSQYHPMAHDLQERFGGDPTRVLTGPSGGLAKSAAVQDQNPFD